MGSTTSTVERPAVYFEETLRQIVRYVVRAEVRAIVREELAAVSASPAPPPPTDQVQLYVTPKTAAEIANVSEKTVRRWIRSGELRATEIGRLVRIRRSDLDQLMEGGTGKKRSTKSADEVALAVLRRMRK